MPPTATQKAYELLAKQGILKIAKSLLKEINETLPSKNTSSRRWIWELLQNAKDVSSNEVLVEITLNDHTVSFSHNGDAFTLADLASLLSQDSTKTPEYTDDEKIDFFHRLYSDQKPEESEVKKFLDKTGKFGSGFMTTYLLSKSVELESVYYDEIKKTYQKFKVSLERGANTPNEMIKKVEESFEIFDQLNDESKCLNITDTSKCPYVISFLNKCLIN